MTLYETLRRYLIVIVFLGLFFAIFLVPGHYLDGDWKNFVSCPSGYALDIEVHEYRRVMRDFGSGQSMPEPYGRIFTFDEECYSLTAPGETVDVRVSFMLVAFLLSLPLAFVAAWFYFHQLVNYKMLPKKNQDWFLRLNIYLPVVFVLAPPLTLFLLDINWPAPVNVITHRPLLSYFLVCLGPTAVTLIVSRRIAGRS